MAGRTPEDAARIVAFRRWQATLRQFTPYAPVTPILMLLNVGVFAAMAVAGARPWNPSTETLLAWGANHGPTAFGGEWWQLFTAAFLHSGLPHLVLNMACLLVAGSLCERLIGGPGFLLMYLASALAGSLTSVAWSPLAVSVGASGAVFGVFGANFAATLRAAETIPLTLLRRLQTEAVKLLAINFAVGFFSPNIDVAAHVGGLACGFVAGFILGHPLRPDAARRRMVRNLGAAVILAPLLGLVAVVASHRVTATTEVFAELDRIAADQTRLLAVYNDATTRLGKGTLDDPGFVAVLDRDVLGPWDDLIRRFEAIWRASGVNREFARLYRDYLAVRGEAFALTRKALVTGDGGAMERANELGRQGDRLAEEITRVSRGNR